MQLKHLPSPKHHSYDCLADFCTEGTHKKYRENSDRTKKKWIHWDQSFEKPGMSNSEIILKNHWS
jgi:hypothetical protein